MPAEQALTHFGSVNGEGLTQGTERDASPSEKERYQGMTGPIMFSMVEARPVIAFVTSLVSRFAKNLSHQHTEAVKNILKYLKGSKDRGITYVAMKS